MAAGALFPPSLDSGGIPIASLLSSMEEAATTSNGNSGPSNRKRGRITLPTQNEGSRIVSRPVKKRKSLSDNEEEEQLPLSSSPVIQGRVVYSYSPPKQATTTSSTGGESSRDGVLPSFSSFVSFDTTLPTQLYPPPPLPAWLHPQTFPSSTNTSSTTINDNGSRKKQVEEVIDSEEGEEDSEEEEGDSESMGEEEEWAITKVQHERRPLQRQRSLSPPRSSSRRFYSTPSSLPPSYTLPQTLQTPAIIRFSTTNTDHFIEPTHSVSPLSPAALGRRNRWNSFQRAELERSFKEDPWPDTLTKQRIASKISMTPAQVATWFQNKRARYKDLTALKERKKKRKDKLKERK